MFVGSSFACLIVLLVISLLLSSYSIDSVLHIYDDTKLSINTVTNLRIQNWNLRYDSKPDSQSIQETIDNLNSTIPYDEEIEYFSHFEEVPWSLRRIGIANDVLFNKVDIFTVNEALKRQIYDLSDLLLPMKWIGVGRDDGKEAGEFQGIYYNPLTVGLVDYDTFWLSDTPFEPSKYPDAGSYRSATVAKFKHLESKNLFVIINLHLDDQSDEQRKLSAALAKIRGSYEYSKYSGKVPVFLVGDFNSQSSGKSSGAYQIATGQSDYNISQLNKEFVAKYNNTLINDFHYLDLLDSTPVQSRMGHHATFTGFKDTTDYYTRIDFQFGGAVLNDDNKELNTYTNPRQHNWRVLRHKVGDSLYDSTRYLSDHRPVICDIQF